MPLETPRECAVRFAHTMCNKAAVLSCAARGETVLSLPPEAPRLCLRRRRANALCDLPVRSAVHDCIAAAASRAH